MISEVIREDDELEQLLMSRGLRKVKDLQSLLWGERGACRGDEVTDVFDRWETKFCFLGVDSDILSAKALEYSSDVTEELRIGFAVYEYIIDVYLADFVNKIEGQSHLTVAFRYGVSLAPLTGLRFHDDAELEQFVDLRADGCLLFSRMVSPPLRSIDFDNH